MKDPLFSQRVLAWFAIHGRKDLPWQTPQDPYRVWISEIMLQQTQVATVILYFERFMGQYPNLERLAESTLEEILSLWAGLGYYARARNLHRTAQILSIEHGGQFPSTLQELQSLPGIGRSTAGAILSLGLGLPAPILDGNVRRVLARCFAIEGWHGQSSTLNKLWELSEALTPKVSTGPYNQAMMDLGALICKPRTPNCDLCPLASACLAHNSGRELEFPSRKPSTSIKTRQAVFLILMNAAGEVYLEARPPHGIWGGLLSLPEFSSLAALKAWCDERFGDAVSLTELPERRHTFSHFHLDFTPVLIHIGELEIDPEIDGGCVQRMDRIDRVPAPIRTLLENLNAQIQKP